jgi:AraC-like DNA-binding protein
LPKESLLGRLLNEHLHALWSAMPSASPLEANAMAEGLAGLVGACFGQASPQEDSPEIQAATLQTLRQFIARYFANPGLGADLLVAQFLISRAQLYRLFKPYGGVARYIQDLRLAWCLGELTHPANRQKRNFEIATRAGFTDESHFSRAFRQAYGVSPREARQGAALGTPLNLPTEGVVDRRYEDWLRQLGGGSIG